MNIRTRLTEYVRACFTGIWIESHEHQEALTEIAELCRDEQWQLATWDIDSGLNIPGQSETENSNSDPLAAIRAVNALATSDGTAIIVLQNFHRFMQLVQYTLRTARLKIQQPQPALWQQKLVADVHPATVPGLSDRPRVSAAHAAPDRCDARNR